jgi:hypothetical protein
MDYLCPLKIYRFLLDAFEMWIKKGIPFKSGAIPVAVSPFKRFGILSPLFRYRNGKAAKIGRARRPACNVIRSFRVKGEG